MIDSGTEFGEIPERWKVKRVEEMIQKIPTWKKYEKKTVFEKWNIPVLDQWKKWLIWYHNDEPGVIASKEDPIIVFANHTCYQNIIMHPFSTIQNVFWLKPNEEYPSDIYRLHYATKDLIELNDYKGHFPEYIWKKVLYPWFDITNIFWNKISSTIKLVYELQKQNQNLKETRDMLIPKLVSGEVEV